MEDGSAERGTSSPQVETAERLKAATATLGR